MELNLLGTLERNVTPSPAANGDRAELCLNLSLRPSSGEITSRKRRRRNDAAVEGEKPEPESNGSIVPGTLSYGLQVVPVILQGPYGDSCFVPCWVPCSAGTFEDSVNEGGACGSLKMPGGSGGLVACAPPSDVGDARSSPESSISRISDGEGICSDDESRSHPSNNTHIDNPSSPSTITNSHENAGRSPLPATQMQAVSTKNAEGRRVNGRLYQLTKNEVRIICDCHGRFFSPARFVRHAGGAETPFPLRQITVVP